mmetsp:Transcript_6670/g.15363  ORF Transcript_6670/g.15363 Transcript_6670/m.15363 type:complete len:272 (+) Transcript_6670:610-1425(+)
MRRVESVLVVDGNDSVDVNLLQDGAHNLLLQVPVLALHSDDDVVTSVLSRSLLRVGDDMHLVEHGVPISDLAHKVVLLHLDGNLGHVEGRALDLGEQGSHHGRQHARAVGHDEAVVLLDDRPSLQHLVPVSSLALLNRGDLAHDLRAEGEVGELEVQVCDLLLGDALDDQLQQLRVPLHPRPKRFRHRRQRHVLVPSARPPSDEKVFVHRAYPPHHEGDDVDVVFDLHHLLQRDAHVLQSPSEDVGVVFLDQARHDLVPYDQHSCRVSRRV